jgi:hypothetical protein
MEDNLKKPLLLFTPLISLAIPSGMADELSCGQILDLMGRQRSPESICVRCFHGQLWNKSSRAQLSIVKVIGFVEEPGSCVRELGALQNAGRLHGNLCAYPLNTRGWGKKLNWRRRGMRMLESTVELLGGLFLSALTLLIGSCIVGSIVAALRAVSRGSATVSARK